MLGSNFSQYITIGDLFVCALCTAFFVYLVQKSKRDLILKQIQVVVDELKDMNREHEGRIRLTEDAIIRLTALQETTDNRMLGLEKQAENFVTDRECLNRHTQGRLDR